MTIVIIRDATHLMSPALCLNNRRSAVRTSERYRTNLFVFVLASIGNRQCQSVDGETISLADWICNVAGLLY